MHFLSSLSLSPLFLFLSFSTLCFQRSLPFFSPVVKVGLSHILSLMQMFLDDKSDVSAARRAQISQNSPYFDLGVGAERKEKGGGESLFRLFLLFSSTS